MTRSSIGLPTVVTGAACLALVVSLVLAAGPAHAAGAAGSATLALPLPLSIPLPDPFPPIRVLTVLVAIHLLGVCFGLGGATMLDFWILRWMRWGGLPQEIARTFLFVSKVVSVGIGLLWISGLGFLAVYAAESPDKLVNPKLWAKIAVVVVLTINGLLIHALVLPGVLRDVSRPMLEGISLTRTGVFLVSGAVSGVSWYTAFLLGLVRELNGRVGASPLLGLWLAGVVAASLGAYLYWLHLREWHGRGAAGPSAHPLPAAPRLVAVPPGRSEPAPDDFPARIPPGRIVPLAAEHPLRSGPASHALGR